MKNERHAIFVRSDFFDENGIVGTILEEDKKNGSATAIFYLNLCFYAKKNNVRTVPYENAGLREITGDLKLSDEQIEGAITTLIKHKLLLCKTFPGDVHMQLVLVDIPQISFDEPKECDENGKI